MNTSERPHTKAHCDAGVKTEDEYCCSSRDAVRCLSIPASAARTQLLPSPVAGLLTLSLLLARTSGPASASFFRASATIKRSGIVRGLSICTSNLTLPDYQIYVPVASFLHFCFTLPWHPVIMFGHFGNWDGKTPYTNGLLITLVLCPSQIHTLHTFDRHQAGPPEPCTPRVRQPCTATHSHAPTQHRYSKSRLRRARGGYWPNCPTKYPRLRDCIAPVTRT